jgi:CheY-like chemotaxis protein
VATRILIIDDNPESLELLAFILNAFHYEVLTARNGLEGMRCLETVQPDLIACDLHMPHMDGTQLAAQVRLSPDLKHIPLVAVTASAMVGDRDRILSLGFDGYISKPLNPETIVDELEAFLSPEKRSKEGPRRAVPDG